MLLDCEKECVTVAVSGDRNQILHVTRGLSLDPETTPAGPIDASPPRNCLQTNAKYTTPLGLGRPAGGKQLVVARPVHIAGAHERSRTTPEGMWQLENNNTSWTLSAFEYKKPREAPY